MTVRWDLIAPRFEEMQRQWVENYPYFLDHWWATFLVSICAAFSALIMAIILSGLALRIKPVSTLVTPFIVLSQSFPIQALAPVLIILLGIGFHTKFAIAFIIALFPIYSQCWGALNSVPTNLMRQCDTFRTTFLKSLIYVRLPWAAPRIVGASKVGFTLAVLGAVVAEFIQPDRGLGRVILVAQSEYNIEVIYIAILLLIIQGLAFYFIMSNVESYLVTRRKI